MFHDLHSVGYVSYRPLLDLYQDVQDSTELFNVEPSMRLKDYPAFDARALMSLSNDLTISNDQSLLGHRAYMPGSLVYPEPMLLSGS